MTNGNSRCKINCLNNGLVVLGLATSHCRNDMKNSRYVDERPHRYHRWHTGVFVGASPVCIPGTPCKLVRSQWEVLHLFRWYTHTSHIARFDFGRASLAGSAIHQLKWTCRMLVYKAALTLFRGEIRRLLEYLDRVVEAHAINHLPRLVEFPRCRSSRQSVW